MTGASERLFDLLEWDSTFFSLRIGRIRGGVLGPDEVALLREQALGESIDCLYFLSDPSSAEALDAAHELGMRPVDVRVDLSVGLPCPLDREAFRSSAREPLASESELLADLSGRLHDSTRFRSDPCFEQDRVTEMYRVWMRRCLSEPHCGALVAGPPGAPTGYCTYSGIGNTGRIELLGVDPRARGAGVGSMLVRSALAAMASRGVETVRVATQGGSRASMGVYQSAGFRVDSIGLWFHYWPAEAQKA